MSERDTGLRHADASDVTRDAFDENLTFGEAGSNSGHKRDTPKLMMLTSLGFPLKREALKERR